MMVRRVQGWLLSMALAVGLAATPGFAQQSGAERREELERQVRAKRDADMLRAEAAKNKGDVLQAQVPLEPQNLWVIRLSNGHTVRIQLRPDVAPLAVERIKTLTQRRFYDGLSFHRVIPGFMAQGGDPKGDGTGGSDLPDLKAEFNWLPHMRGTVAMARAGNPDSANSQFYIMLAPRFQLDHKYTVVGRVIEGIEGIDAIATGEPPAKPTTIVSASVGDGGTALSGS